MHGPSTDFDAASQFLTWGDHNTRGLECASEGAWEDARSAFSGAVDALATENDVASHEALALVLNNLAQSCYRLGRIDDAIAHVQRVCALRIALVGEDAIVVARARTDLAVMISATGRPDEAMALVTRAISSIERSAGDESLHLQYALENAARLAMSSGQPSSAEPYLLRLHALLGAHELPTDRADALLALVSQHRANASVTLRMLTPVMNNESVTGVATESAQGAEPTENAEAPATDIDVVAVVAEPLVIEDPIVADEPIAVEESIDVSESIVAVESIAAEAAMSVAKSFASDLEELTLEDTNFDAKSPSDNFLGIEFELVELTPANNPALAAPAPVATSATSVSNVLGFEVSYGTQTEEEAALAESIAPPVSVRVPTPPPAKVVNPPAASPPPPTLAPTVPNPSVQGAGNAPRAVSPAVDNTRERKIRLPRILFR